MSSCQVCGFLLIYSAMYSHSVGAFREKPLKNSGVGQLVMSHDKLFFVALSSKLRDSENRQSSKTTICADALRFKLFKSKFTSLEIKNVLIALRIYQRQNSYSIQTKLWLFLLVLNHYFEIQILSFESRGMYKEFCFYRNGEHIFLPLQLLL